MEPVGSSPCAETKEDLGYKNTVSKAITLKAPENSFDAKVVLGTMGNQITVPCNREDVVLAKLNDAKLT